MRGRIKAAVIEYFDKIRPDLITNGHYTQEIDEKMQELLRITHVRTALSTYKVAFESLKSLFITLDADKALQKSNQIVKSKSHGSTTLSNQEIVIISTLEKLVPASALGYEQVLSDLNSERISYRGTAAELREILRELLDHLAEDKHVSAEPGFKLEANRSGPTMKQKVLYILKKRSKKRNAMQAPKEAAAIVEESIAKFARAVYVRGSISTHAEGEGREEIVQIKRYLDSLLCELLEIHL